ncbi:MAG: hypothetical protein Q4D60_05385 [Eubacteriales bacterium]|nr:hypothetical protein [Eubacteriales bacterium]
MTVSKSGCCALFEQSEFSTTAMNREDAGTKRKVAGREKNGFVSVGGI